MKPTSYLRVAVPTPLRSTFDYLFLPGLDAASVRPGQRVKVPFGRRELVAFVLSLETETSIPADRLKTISAIIDDEPALDEKLLALYLWAARYYHYSPGQALQTSLPKAVRSGKALQAWSEPIWELSDEGRQVDPASLGRAPRQAAIMALLATGTGISSSELNRKLETSVTATLKTLHEKGWVMARRDTLAAAPSRSAYSTTALALNTDQQQAVSSILATADSFACHLLEGITGSGKTEVYLQVIEAILAQGRQVLILVPEIGLTPQTIQRFKERFAHPLVALHSNLSDSERFNAWLHARSGQARIIIGTRSAIFTPMPDPGLIIVDEEHDASFKQQDGFRYSARDLATWRGRQENIPVILGSATPSLESLNNALAGRYQHLHLRERAGGARQPHFRFIDLRGEVLQEGFSTSLLSEMGFHLKQQQQVLVFINRRGFSPILQCHDCGWIANCTRCDMSYTLHQNPPRLCCHHCDGQKPLPSTCPECNSQHLLPIGVGTERSEQFLKKQFPAVPVLRVDRDSTRKRDSLKDMLDQVNTGQPCILIGTQMLAKGHHFPGVTLVAVLEADTGLFSANFRGQELLGQLLIQVAGRAGRGNHPGEVLIQTHHQDHPGLNLLVSTGYGPFARQLLEQRKQQNLPPFSYQALIRAEANQRHLPEGFLHKAAGLARQLATANTAVLGPLPAPLEKRAGKFRFQLLLEAHSRAALHQLLQQLLPVLDEDESGRRVRWSVDVDPLDFT